MKKIKEVEIKMQSNGRASLYCESTHPQYINGVIPTPEETELLITRRRSIIGPPYRQLGRDQTGNNVITNEIDPFTKM